MENIKVATAAIMTLLNDPDDAKTNPWNNYGDYNPMGDYDDMWLEEGQDDWVVGEGARFGDDDLGFDPWAESWGDEDGDDGFGIPVEKPSDRKLRIRKNNNNSRKLDYAGLDVSDIVYVFCLE